MRDPIRLTRFFIEAPESIRVRVLRDAAAADDRPAILRGEEGRLEEGLQWIRRNQAKITGPLLRYADLDDDTIAYLASEGSIAPGHPASSAAVFRFPHSERQHGAKDGSCDLADLAVNAKLLQELVTALAKASEPFGIEAPAPRVRVSVNGAVHFELDGGVLTAGAALAIQAAEGVISTVLSTPPEALGAASEARQGARHRSAASALVPRETVLEACKRLDLLEAYANHLLNRVLPVAARLAATGVRVEARA